MVSLNTIPCNHVSTLGTVQRDDNASTMHASTMHEGLMTKVSLITKIGACILGGISATNWANFSARSLLGTCHIPDSLVNNKALVSNLCDLPYDRSLFWGGLSIALFTASITLPYTPSVVDRIKNLTIFGKFKETTSKDVETLSDSKNLGKVTNLSDPNILAPVLSLAGVMKGLESLIHFSEAAGRSLLGTCEVNRIVEGYKITDFACQYALKNGHSQILAACILVTTAGALVIVDRSTLPGRFKKIFN